MEDTRESGLNLTRLSSHRSISWCSAMTGLVTVLIKLVILPLPLCGPLDVIQPSDFLLYKWGLGKEKVASLTGQHPALEPGLSRKGFRMNY